MAVINVAGYLREETQMVCNLILPHEDDILNKFRIWNERHLQVRKPYQLPGWTKTRLTIMPRPGFEPATSCSP